MYSAIEERGIEILNSFLNESNLSLKMSLEDLRVQVESEGLDWLLFLSRIGKKDFDTLNFARTFIGLKPWSMDDVIINL